MLTCAFGVAVGLSFALFTAKKTVNNHINAGDLKVGFYLAELKYDQISGGTLVERTENLTTWAGYVKGKGVDLFIYADGVINVNNFAPSMGVRYIQHFK